MLAMHERQQRPKVEENACAPDWQTVRASTSITSFKHNWLSTLEAQQLNSLKVLLVQWKNYNSSIFPKLFEIFFQKKKSGDWGVRFSHVGKQGEGSFSWKNGQSIWMFAQYLLFLSMSKWLVDASSPWSSSKESISHTNDEAVMSSQTCFSTLHLVRLQNTHPQFTFKRDPIRFSCPKEHLRQKKKKDVTERINKKKEKWFFHFRWKNFLGDILFRCRKVSFFYILTTRRQASRGQ